MKITEIRIEPAQEELDEAVIRPLGSAIKGFAQGGFSGAAAGWRAKQSAIEQQKMLRYLSQQATAAWGKQLQNLKAARRTPSPAEAQQFLAQWIGGTPSSLPTSGSPANFKKWAEKEIANRLAGGAPMPGLPPGAGGVSAGGAPAASASASATATGTGTGPSGVGAGPSAGLPPSGASAAIYSDYRALRANWIAWTRHPEFKSLIDDRDLLDALKRMQARASTIRENKNSVTKGKKYEICRS